MTIDNSVRFCQNNFLQADWAGVTFSSTSTTYPSSNALEIERYKYWRPSGLFEVTALNNLIYINDGTNKTVTLTAGPYTPTTLASHIQTQLNASSTNWTCTYSTPTRKFTIGRSSGTRLLRFSQTTNASWDMLGYTQVADTDPGTGLAATEPRRHTSDWVRADFGVPVTPKFFAMIGPTDEEIGFSDNVVLTVKANIVNDFTSPPLNVTVSLDRGNFFKFFDGLTTTYRYWEIRWTDRESLSDWTITQVYLGDYVAPVMRNFSIGFSAILEDPTVVQNSVSGVGFYRLFPKYWRFESLVAEYIEDDDRDELLRVFRELGVSRPLFVSLDPKVEISSSLGEFTKYMTFETAPRLIHILRDLYNLELSLREVSG